MNFPISNDLPANEILSSHAYQSYQRQRQLTLGDLLLENRIVFLQGEIHYANANDVVMKLLYLQSENRRKDIHFYINSPGGSVTATLAIMTPCKFFPVPLQPTASGKPVVELRCFWSGARKAKEPASLTAE